MNFQESLTQKWLRQNVSPYPQQDRVYADIDAALNRFSTLRPKSDVYTYDDGRTQLLLCVHGLLPISYRQASYNIPIAIWVTREYPRLPPIAYVVPTGEMLVKASKYVQVSGRCYIEYLQSWERKSEGCHLSGLLDAMQIQFSNEPPLYAKPRGVRTEGKHATPPGERPSPSLPSTDAHLPSPQSTPLPVIQNARPDLPPKPGSSQSGPRLSSPLHPSPPNGIVQSQLHSNVPLATSRPPALPPHPPEFRPPQYRNSLQTPPIPPNYQPTHTQTTNNSTAVPTWQPVAPNNRWSTPWPQHPQVANTNLSDPNPPAVHLSPSQVPSIQPSFVLSQKAPSPPVPVPNLLDAEDLDTGSNSTIPTSVSAPPPPRPPNPELLHLHAQVHHKITTELASLSQALALDAERLRAHQTDLLAGEPAIRDEMARLEAVRDVCRNVAGRMRLVVDQAEKNVTELRRKGDPEVDELVCSTSIVHNQLINLVAEDNAIEDTIYHLHRALNTGRIDLERFLRTIRVLAEEQFMKRALIEKIHAGMPMGMAGRSNWS